MINTQDIWSIAGAVITSVGGAGVIIWAVSGFVGNRIAKRLDTTYEQRLNIELEKYKATLDQYRHITKTQFDKEFEIYHQLSKLFFSMIVKLSSFTEDTYELKDEQRENQIKKIEEFMHLMEVVCDAQNALYENAAFIPKDIFERYDSIYNKTNDLFWLYYKRLREYDFIIDNFDTIITDEDKATTKEIEKEFSSVNEKLREYLSRLSIVV